jgi:hypothetical protein
MQEGIRFSIAVLILFTMSGCALTSAQILSSVGFFTADTVLEAKTGKNITDNIISDVVGKDCKVKHVFNEKDFCKEKVEKASE